MVNSLVDLAIWAGLYPAGFNDWYKLNPVIKSVRSISILHTIELHTRAHAHAHTDPCAHAHARATATEGIPGSTSSAGCARAMGFESSVDSGCLWLFDA